MLHTKTEVVIKTCFCKKVVFSISGESWEGTCSFSIMLEKSIWSSSLLMQLLFRYFSKILLRFYVISFSLRFTFLIARIFQNISFSLPFKVAVLGITQQQTRWETILILFKFLGCLRLPESSIKILGMILMG